MVFKVFRGGRHVGYINAADNSEAMDKARNIRPNDPGPLSVSKPSVLGYHSLSKEMLAEVLNEQLKIKVPWTRLSRDDLLLVVYAVLHLV